jgi:hypothetical protein
VWSRVIIPIDSLALTYQGQLVERKLDFQADKVIAVGVSVSATTPEAAPSSSSSSVSNSSSAQGGGAPAAADDASSSGSGSGSGGSVGLADGSSSTADELGTSEAQPHELFRLLIRDIRAEGEM